MNIFQIYGVQRVEERSMSELVEIWHVFDKKGSAPHRFKIARAGSVGAVVGGTLAQASGWRHLETFATYKEKPLVANATIIRIGIISINV